MDKVFVTRRLPGTALEDAAQVCDLEIWPEERPLSPEELRHHVKGKTGLLSMLTDRIDAPLMDAAHSLKVVSNYAVGFDNIDVTAATAAKIAVGNTPDVLTDATADLAFSLLMAAARRLMEGWTVSRTGQFEIWSPTMLLGSDVHGATLGIVGMGRIGRAMARRARGFDMTVRFCGGRLLPDEVEGATRTDLSTLLRTSDFVSLHVPLTNETHHLIDARALGSMKPGSVLINTARGPVVDQDALVSALRRGAIGCAALDVTTPEPLPMDHPLFQLDNCIIVPHLGSATKRTREKMARMAVENLLAGLRGEPLPHCVNPEVYASPTVLTS